MCEVLAMMRTLAVSLAFFLSVGLLSSLANGTSQQLDIYLVFSDSERYNSSEAVYSVREAVNDVTRSGLLPNYSFSIVEQDAKCDGSRTLQQTLQYVANPPPFVAIIGGGCSPATDMLVEIAEYQNIPLISYTPGSTLRSTNYFQLYPSDESLILSLAVIIKEYGWKQISIITEMDKKLFEVEYYLNQRLAMDNITVLKSYHILPDKNISDTIFNNSQARIFFLNTFENTARKVLCEAYNMRMYYPNYGWLLYGWYSKDWLVPDASSMCTEQELRQVIDRAVTVHQHEPVETSTYPSFISLFAYDAMWALAKALNASQAMIDDDTEIDMCNGMPGSITSINSSSAFCLVRYNLLNMAFPGRSGDVALNQNGERQVSTVYVRQYRAGSSESVEFATINVTQSLFEYLANETESTVWPEGIPPDGLPINEFSTYSIVLRVVMYGWSTIGIIFSICCLVFNIIFRKRKIIRLTSPNLNYFIIGGAILLYSISYFVLLDQASESVAMFVCLANIWVLSFGISLCFAPILAKMLRIYRIFRNPRANKKVLTDWHLFFIVLIVESVVLFLLFLGTVIPFTRPVVSYTEDRETLPTVNEMGITIQYLGTNCYTTGSFAWIIIIALYIGVLEAIAVVLAAKTRQVKVEAVNDSKEVVAVVYIVTACSIALLVFSYVLQDYSNISEGLYLTAILVGTTSTVTLMFIPKMWSLYKDPTGENVFEPPQSKSGSMIQSQLHRQDSERIEYLEREVGTLKMRLRENSFRLSSVPEVNDIDEKVDQNGLGHVNNNQLPEVFSPPATPAADKEGKVFPI